MAVTQSPASWVAPAWHPDFGDARVELEHLRKLADTVLRDIPQAGVTLESPEPGLMYLRIARNGSMLAEVYSIRQDSRIDVRTYGVFLLPDSSAEEEHYASTVADAISLLNVHCGHA